MNDFGTQSLEDRRVASLQRQLELVIAERDQMKAIVDTHNLCHDLHGKVGQKEFEEGCRRESAMLFGSCGWGGKLYAIEALARSYNNPGVNVGAHDLANKIIKLIEE